MGSFFFWKRCHGSSCDVSKITVSSSQGRMGPQRPLGTQYEEGVRALGPGTRRLQRVKHTLLRAHASALSPGTSCTACVGKEASACSRTTWPTASHPPSADTTRRAAAPTGRVAGKSASAPAVT